MYTYESGKRPAHPTDRAHDYLADVAHTTCSPEDVAAALRVLKAMTDRAALQPLFAKASWDEHGNAILDTPEQHLHWATYCEAGELMDRLEHVRNALSHATTQPSEEAPSDALMYLSEALRELKEIDYPDPYTPKPDPDPYVEDYYHDGPGSQGPGIER